MTAKPTLVTAPAADQESTVPRLPLAQLYHVSQDRYNSVCKRTEEYDDLPGAIRTAMAYHELATMENDTLRKLRLLVRAQVCFDELSNQLEALQKVAGQMAGALSEKTIPDVMDNAELEHFSLAGGRRVEIEDKVHAALPAERMAAGCARIEQKGFGTLIKRKIALAFNTKQGKEADKVVRAITRALGEQPSVELSDERTVHPQTLGKWVRDQLESGEQFSTEDMKLFGVFRKRRAVIKEKKSKD